MVAIIEGLTKKEIYTRLNDDPDDIVVNSMYKVLWRNGIKPHKEHIVKNNDNISFNKRNIVPNTIDFNLVVKIPMDLLYAEMHIDERQIPIGETIIIPTQVMAEDINMVFNENTFGALLNWFRLFYVNEGIPFKKADIVDDIAFAVNENTFDFRCMFPSSFRYSDDNKTCKVCFIYDYMTITL